MPAKKERVPETVEFLRAQGFTFEGLNRQQEQVLTIDLETVKDRLNNLIGLFPSEVREYARKSLAKHMELLGRNKETIKGNLEDLIGLFPSEVREYARKSLGKNMQLLGQDKETIKDNFENLINLFPAENRNDAKKSLAKHMDLLWRDKETIKDNFENLINLFPAENRNDAKKSLSKNMQLLGRDKETIKDNLGALFLFFYRYMPHEEGKSREEAAREATTHVAIEAMPFLGYDRQTLADKLRLFLSFEKDVRKLKLASLARATAAIAMILAGLSPTDKKELTRYTILYRVWCIERGRERADRAKRIAPAFIKSVEEDVANLGYKSWGHAVNDAEQIYSRMDPRALPAPKGQ